MLPEDTVRAWEKLQLQQRREVWKEDPVLCYFDGIHVQDCLEGKNESFSMEEIMEIQDKLPPAPTGDDSVIFSIFGKNGVRSKVARSHKLNKVITDRLTTLSNAGITVARTRPAETNSTPVVESSAPPAPKPVEARNLQALVEAVPAPLDQTQISAPRATGQSPSSLKYLTFATDMPEEAKINLRKEPNTEAQIVGECRFGTVLTSPSGVQAGNDWAQVYVNGDPQQLAWILVRVENRQLLVECPSGHATQAPSSEDQENSQAQDNKLEQPQSPTFLASAKIDRESTQDRPQPALTPLDRGNDSERPVTLAEFNRMRTKVAQLEADLRALRLLLRSA